MKQTGDVVQYSGVDGSKRNVLIIGVRTEPETHIGPNGEPLLSLGYFNPGQTFGSAEPIILHDVPHSSVEGIVGTGRWDELEAPEPQAKAAEVHPDGGTI